MQSQSSLAEHHQKAQATHPVFVKVPRAIQQLKHPRLDHFISKCNGFVLDEVIQVRIRCMDTISFHKQGLPGLRDRRTITHRIRRPSASFVPPSSGTRHAI